jgi:type I restriction enzyme, S subunit
VSGWPLVTLGDIFTIARGGSPRPIDAFLTEDPEGVNWIMIGDAAEGSKYILSTKKRIRRDGVSRSRRVNPGDLLLTNSMSFGRPYILKTSGCIHDGWLVLSPRSNEIAPDFFYHMLGSAALYQQFSRLAAGAVVKNLNIDLVKSVQVSLPPLREQLRLAGILDKADAIRRRRKEAITLTEEMLRSAFLEMFGDPVTNPKRWDVKPLGDLVDIRGGGTPSRNRADFFQGSIPWATAKDFKSDFMSDTQEHISNEAVRASATQVVPAGTLLVVVKSKILMRRLPIAVTRVPLCFNQDVKGLIPFDLNEGAYLSAHLRLAQRQLLDLARGVNTEGLTLPHLRSHAVMQPPTHLRRSFTAFESRAREGLDREALALRDAESLFDSLVTEAFAYRSTNREASC